MPTYTNSPMVQVVKLAPNYYHGRITSNNPTGKIDKITIHHMAGVLTAERCGEVFQTAEASTNYGIGCDGKVGMYVEEKNGGWASCNKENDCRAITIEVSNSVAGGDWPVSNQSYSILIDLCVDICRRNGIKRLNYTGDKNGNLTMHCWFASTACPGPYLKARFADITLKVNQKLGDTSYVVPSYGVSVDGSQVANSYQAAATGSLSINTESIDKYMITLDRNSEEFDYDKMKDLGVIGVNIEGGYLFDSSHNRVKYRNPKLMKQVDKCKEANMLYSLYVETRARSIEEALEELYEVQLLLATYPPDLGIWLVTHFTENNRTKNNAILDIYYEYLVSFGMKYKMGLYVSPHQLKTIDWKKHSENWHLWLDSHIPSMSNIPELLTPQFFVPEGVGSE